MDMTDRTSRKSIDDGGSPRHVEVVNIRDPVHLHEGESSSTNSGGQGGARSIERLR